MAMCSGALAMAVLLSAAAAMVLAVFAVAIVPLWLHFDAEGILVGLVSVAVSVLQNVAPQNKIEQRVSTPSTANIC